MKFLFGFSLLVISHINMMGQGIYESPLGFTINFDKTWKRLPKEVLIQKMRDVKDLLEYRKDVQFDACYQKVGNADMDYPYILFKNVYATTSNENEMRKVQEYFTSKPNFDKVVQKIVNGKFDYELKIGKNYYDTQNKMLIFTYDMGISIKGNLVGMFAFYFGKNASLITYCYSYKDEFKYDQKEFLEVIYSINDKGMTSTMPKYLEKHDAAVRHYNQGLQYSNAGMRREAIQSYSKAIESYPTEDNFVKAEAYFNRGLNKRYVDDIKGAIADYNEAIKLRSNYYKAYNNRGYAKLLLEDYKGAIEDFSLTIKYDNYNTEYSNMALGNRGVAKLGLELDGCPDLKKAMELGNKNVEAFYKEYCK